MRRSSLFLAAVALVVVPGSAAAKITIALSPDQATVLTTQTQDFTAVVTGTTNKTVRFKVCDGNGINCVLGGNTTLGTIIDTGLTDVDGNHIARYTAPVGVPAPPACTSVGDGCQVRVRANLTGSRRRRKKKAFAPLTIIARPTISSFSPSIVVAGGPDLTLTVTGSGFLGNSVVQWNGSDRATSFVSNTQLTATILATDITAPGVGQVTVFNPGPPGVTSSPVPLVITLTAVGVIERVSVASDGTQGNDHSGGLFFGVSISADGRFVAFTSAAANLVAGDTNGAYDVFVRDTCLGVPTGCTPSTVRVSVASDGTQGNGLGARPAVSADGRFVAFQSFASNLVAGDTNGAFDVFVRDTCFGATGCTPSTARVSVASDGTQGNGESFAAAISADGRFVAFGSSAPNLVAGDTNGLFDVFVRDTCLGVPTGCAPSTTRVSVASDGSQANGGSTSSSLSADGRFVAFGSFASNLVAGDTNVAGDAFVRDTCFGATGCTPSTVRVSVASDGTQGNGESSAAAISAEGRFVAFPSRASNLVAGDTNGFEDVFVRDTCVGATSCTPSTVRVSVASDGTQGNNFYSQGASISADGRFVAFESNASTLVAGDTNGAFDGVDVFVRDTCLGVPTGCTPSTVRVSVASDGTQGNRNSSGGFLGVSISADGRFVAFQSSATTLVAGDTNNALDVFLARSGFAGPAITTTFLPEGAVNTAYSATVRASGDHPPFTWSIVEGAAALPPGLSLDASTGVISGTPTTTGTFTFTAQVTDSANPAQTDTQVLSIAIL